MRILLMCLLTCSPAFGDQGWLGQPWRLMEIHCPFGCSKPIQDSLAKERAEPVVLAKEKVILPKIIGACLPPAKPDWGAIQAIQLGEFLAQWSDNEAAAKKARTRKNLARKIGLQSNTPVSAGIVRCSDGSAFNFIYVSPRKAFILFEENSYFELSR